MSTPLKQNTTDLQIILNTINSLPDESNGIELPSLSNEGTASDLLSGKQLIDQEGNIVTGTFTIDSELSTQNDLISQIQTALQNKVVGDSTGGNNSVGNWINVANLPTTYSPDPPTLTTKNYYIELEDNVDYVLFVRCPTNVVGAPEYSFIVYWELKSVISNDTVFINTSDTFTINDVSTDGVKILELVSIESDIADTMHFLPIYRIS